MPCLHGCLRHDLWHIRIPHSAGRGGPRLFFLFFLFLFGIQRMPIRLLFYFYASEFAAGDEPLAETRQRRHVCVTWHGIIVADTCKSSPMYFLSPPRRPVISLKEQKKKTPSAVLFLYGPCRTPSSSPVSQMLRTHYSGEQVIYPPPLPTVSF